MCFLAPVVVAWKRSSAILPNTRPQRLLQWIKREPQHVTRLTISVYALQMKQMEEEYVRRTQEAAQLRPHAGTENNTR